MDLIVQWNQRSRTHPRWMPWRVWNIDNPTPGCPDSDDDGWANTDDDFPLDPTQFLDYDGDGFGDNAGTTPMNVHSSSVL